jgi:hypothetical protein
VRAPRALRRHAATRTMVRQMNDLADVIRGELEAARPEPAGFQPTSGYAATERSYPAHDWSRPTVIGFRP